VTLDIHSHVKSQIILHKGDITDSHSLVRILRDVRPDEIYHLAGQSHVSQSFETPSYTMQVNAMGTLNLLQAIVCCGLQTNTRLYNVSLLKVTIPHTLRASLT